MKRLTIGEMSELNNVSTQTLRLYDKLDILKPKYIDKNNGYRYYSIYQSATLDIIQNMKSLGMSLKEINNNLDKNDLSTIKDILNKKRNTIDKKIMELNEVKSAIDRAIENIERYNSAPKEGIVLLEYIPKRTVYRYKGNMNIYDNGIECYEYMLRNFKRHINSKKIPLLYFCNVGSFIRKENLLNKNLVSNEIFIFVDSEEFNDNENIEQIQASTYLTIYCDSFSKELDYLKKLMYEIKDKDYKIIGDYICEVVVELPMLNNNERNMFIKLQIPIKI
ncbi:MerR family transcriptional regulator [Clostridium sardiniense]|uniref:MerR family transcriptional regulator n=1 Tax=Clostridium sardiniense TaxID=29369 RepID=UPI003D324DF4